MATAKHNSREVFTQIIDECHDLNSLVRGAYARLIASENRDEDQSIQDAFRILRVIEGKMTKLANAADNAGIDRYTEALSCLGIEEEQTDPEVSHV